MLLRFINPIIIFCLKWKLVCLLLFSDWRAEVTNIRATSSAFKWLKFCQYVHIFININICTYLYIFVYETLSLGAWNPFNWDWNWLSNMWEHVANCWNDLPKNGCKFQWRHGGNGKNTTQHNWALGNKRKYFQKKKKKRKENKNRKKRNKKSNSLAPALSTPRNNEIWIGTPTCGRAGGRARRSTTRLPARPLDGSSGSRPRYWSPLCAGMHLHTPTHSDTQRIYTARLMSAGCVNPFHVLITELVCK